jgi:Na+/H+ antiporter NhaA
MSFFRPDVAGGVVLTGAAASRWRGTNSPSLVGAAIAGIGFTVPRLIAERASSGQPRRVTAATVALLASSVVAFMVGAAILMRAHMLTPTADPDRGTARRGRERARGDTP